MTEMKDRVPQEQSTLELIIAGKIIASILLGLLCGFFAYFAFYGMIVALFVALIVAGLLAGTFFAPEEGRKSIALVLVILLLVAIAFATLIRIGAKSYAAFFENLGGIAWYVALIALVSIVVIIAQEHNSNVNRATVPRGNAVSICVGTFFVSLAVWFTSGMISKIFRPQPLAEVVVANVDKATKRQTDKASADQKAKLLDEQLQRQEQQNLDSARRAKFDAEKWRSDFEQDQLKKRQEEEKRTAYFSNRAFEMSAALRLDKDISEFVRGAIYFNKGARFTVENSWHSLSYQVRFQGVQNLGALWKKFAQSNEPDSEIFKVVDLNGNEVGGSGVFGIWVQKEQ